MVEEDIVSLVVLLLEVILVVVIIRETIKVVQHLVQAVFRSVLCCCWPWRHVRPPPRAPSRATRRCTPTDRRCLPALPFAEAPYTHANQPQTVAATRRKYREPEDA